MEGLFLSLPFKYIKQILFKNTKYIHNPRSNLQQESQTPVRTSYMSHWSAETQFQPPECGFLPTETLWGSREGSNCWVPAPTLDPWTQFLTPDCSHLVPAANIWIVSQPMQAESLHMLACTCKFTAVFPVFLTGQINPIKKAAGTNCFTLIAFAWFHCYHLFLKKCHHCCHINLTASPAISK